MEELKFKRGDVVKLKSDSPNLTVVGYIEPIDIKALAYRTEPRDMGNPVIVQVTWFEGSKAKGNKYHEDLLELVRASN